MYNTILEVLNLPGKVSVSERMIIIAICGVVIVMLIAVFIDLIFRIFSHFWR